MISQQFDTSGIMIRMNTTIQTLVHITQKLIVISKNLRVAFVDSTDIRMMKDMYQS